MARSSAPGRDLPGQGPGAADLRVPVRLGLLPQVVEYQVRQTERGADIRLVAPAGLDTLTLQHKVEERLAAVGLHEPAITVTLTSSLNRQASAS